MEILELGIGETSTLAPGIRVTVLSILSDGVLLQIDALPHVTITTRDLSDISLMAWEEEFSDRDGN